MAASVPGLGLASRSAARRAAACPFQAVVASLLVMLLAAGCQRTDETLAKPNVILYLVDTLRSDHLDVYGYNRETAPRLREFAADSVRFTNAYTPTSWTKPATVSVLTGLNPSRHRVITRSHRVGTELRLISEYLQENGYRTAAFTANLWIVPYWGFGQGFDHFPKLIGRDVPPPADVSPPANMVIDEVLRHLEDVSEPFFAYIHTVDPHAGYAPPAPYRTMWPRAFARVRSPDAVTPNTDERILADMRSAYDGEIRFGDAHFGRLIDSLKADGRYEEALIIFVADHGEEFGDHGGGGHGKSLFEEVVRAPLIVKFPGSLLAGTVVDAPTSVIDVLPTVLGYLGLGADGELDGEDLLARMGRGAPENDRALFFDLDLVYSERERNLAKAIIAGDHKYVDVKLPRARQLLFDLKSDPKEERNLASARPEIVRELQAQLSEHDSGVEEGLYFTVLNEPVQQPAAGRCRGELRVDTGRFLDLERWQFEATDRAALSKDGKTLEFDVESRNFPNDELQVKRWNVDEDTLAFRVEPSDTPVTVRAFECDRLDGLRLFKGLKLTPVDEIPFSFAADDPGLWVADLSSVFKPSLGLSTTNAAGGYIMAIPRREGVEMDELDEETRERLRALGYIND